MGKKLFRSSSKVWPYPGMAAWRFISLSKTMSKEIRDQHGKRAKGWGSLPVTVTIGKTTWQTSIFPDKKSDTYLLPLKKSVRKAEDIYDDDTVRFSMVMR